MKNSVKRIIKPIIISVVGTIIVFAAISSLQYHQRSHKVLINDSEKVVMEFGSNKIEINSVLFSGWILDYNESLLYIYMKYYLEDEIKIHRDAINIEYEGKAIEWFNLHNIDSDYKRPSLDNISFDSVKKVMSQGIVGGPDYKLSGNGHLSLHPIIGDDIEVKEGDKIKITAPDFITYNGDTVSLEEMTIEIGKFFTCIWGHVYLGSDLEM